MKFIILSFCTLVLSTSLAEEAIYGAKQLHKRLAPSGNYAPTTDETCPTSLIREATSLSQDETEWLQKRKEITTPILRQWLASTNLSTNLDTLFSNTSNIPTIALAFSGGGYRAMLNGAGVINALDNRTAPVDGGLGGILQASTYIAGLSGGSWLIGSMTLNNFTILPTLLNEVWDIETDLVNPGGINIFETTGFLIDLHDEVDEKRNTGFNVTITDYWARALARHLFPDSQTNHIATVFSDIQQYDTFSSAQQPFPLVVADGRDKGQVILYNNATNYEINPFEFGSWDDEVRLFTPMKYLGSDVNNGQGTNGTCTEGFDNAMFILGTSSSLFNNIILNIPENSSSILYSALRSVLTDIGDDSDDIAYYPNPFRGVENSNLATRFREYNNLSLVDGGSDLQNIPYNPLLQPERAVDVIISVDSSADTIAAGYSGWPNGTSLVATFERARMDRDNTAFPSIPDTNTFVNLGLNNRPVFFGCNESNFTSGSTSRAQPPPLVVYIPNAPYSGLSNTSTFQLSYELPQQYEVVVNGFNEVTQGNGTLDAEWPTCVACAIVLRSLQRSATSIPAECQSCLQRYCWDGSLNNTETIYQPNFKLSGADLYTSSSSIAYGSVPQPLYYSFAFLSIIPLIYI